ncbi:MAG: RecX family transcriptional regulator [Bacteroidaceae bacterium]|nr:RecX family transcriptional regulator [Bacteroidaceae bacterium]
MMTEEEAFIRACRYCSGAEHCRREVDAMLKRCQIDEISAVRILDRLEKENYIDEKRYAKAFVHDKLLFCRWGRVKINYALQQKRIPGNIIDEALSSIDQDEYYSVLKSAADSFRRTVKGTNGYERNMHLLKRLCSRGFEQSIVSKVLKMSESSEEQD